MKRARKKPEEKESGEKREEKRGRKPDKSYIY